MIFFLFLQETCCGNSLEVPQLGASNGYHNKCFHGEIRQRSVAFG